MTCPSSSSITTPANAERIRQVRKASWFLVTIGACAASASYFLDLRVSGT